MQQAANQAMGGRPGFLGPFPMTWDATGGFKMESCGIGSKPIVQFGGTGKSGGVADKFLQAVQRSVDECRQAAQSAGVMYAGEQASAPSRANIGHGGGGGRDLS